MRKILFFSVLLLFYALASGQAHTVTGKVVDAQGKAVPFASITIKSSGVGTSADENGDFSLQVSPNSILVFSAAGYEASEVNIGSKTYISTTITSQSAMSEVVVTALGVRRQKNTLPYAAQQVSGDEVSRIRGGNAASGLSGKVAGLQIIQGNSIGGSTNVVIRGTKSLTGNNQALFVVDGVPINNQNNFDKSKINAAAANQVTGRGVDMIMVMPQRTSILMILSRSMY